MSTAAYITTPSEGVNFNQTYTAYDQTAAITATNSPDNPGPPFSAGTYMRGTNESEFVLIKASAAISLGHTCVMDAAYNAQPVTTALALLGKLLGVAPVAIASGSYGWIQRAGTVDGGILAVANTQPNVGILATTVAGVVSSTTTTGNKNINGMILNVTNGTTTTSVGVGILNYPVVGTTTT